MVSLSHQVVRIVAMLILMTPAVSLAQSGTIRGRTVDARVSLPLTAQASIPTLGVGVMSDRDGRFVINNVPAGTHELHVQMLGYRSTTIAVTVVTGEVAEVYVQLEEQPLAMDEIVVTGTAGGAQRRAVGNVVDRLSASDIREVVPTADVAQLIGSRSAGVMMLGASGGVGTGSRIRIRGTGSMGLSNDPLVYVDGVRMDARPDAGPSQRGGARVSRLNDINPEDIESIEIIKGPAAATLYGTEASNGVIHIITRRGQSGAPQFDVGLQTGTHWLWNPAGRQGLSYASDPTSGELVSFNVYEHEKRRSGKDIFRYGSLYSLTTSVSGGTDATRYFIAGGYSDDTGVRPENWDRRLNLRTNLDLILNDALSATVSVGYLESETRLAQGSFDNDPFSNIYWANPLFIDQNGGYFRSPPEEWGKVDDRIGVIPNATDQ